MLKKILIKKKQQQKSYTSILQVLDLDYLKNSYNCINFIRFSKNRYNFIFL